jgi:HAD superfamily hydrolase (TIGR01484 family)
LREVAELVVAMQASEGVQLAYVTGRHLSLAEQGIAEVGLPKPDWFVCDVGTSVYHREVAGFQPDETYREAMRAAFGGLGGADVREAVGEVEGIELQEEEKQAEFKVSYYTRGRHEPYVGVVQSRLDTAGARINLVSSFDPVSGRGLLDVLPAGVAKDYAIRYLHEHTGIDAEHLVYAGDSGNDRAAMLSGFRAIVVGNADEVLKEELKRASAAKGLSERLYFAQEPYAAGVLEGLRHFALVG